MTEAEWAASADPEAMFLALRPLSARKGRLLAAACFRRLSSFLDPETQVARNDFLDAMERRADEPHPDNWAEAVIEDLRVAQPYDTVDGCAEIAAAYYVIPYVGLAGGLELSAVYAEDRGVQREAEKQASLVRDVFGSPFRPVFFPVEWRTEAVVSLARQMYTDREFSAMPIVADALEEAGCVNADVLNHCRLPGVHVRGCWALDPTLGTG